MSGLDTDTKFVRAGTRLAILVIGAVILGYLSYRINGTIVPTSNPQAAVFQGGLLLVVMGSLLLEDKFTRPVDAVVNSLTGAICLGTVVETNYGRPWLALLAYCGGVFLLGVVSVALGVPGERGGFMERASRIFYQLATTFGKARILFSAIFLFSVFSYYGYQSREALILIIFWGTYLALWPLKIPHVIQAVLLGQSLQVDRVGTVLRMENPNLARVQLQSGTEWSADTRVILCTGEGRQLVALPLYKQVQQESVVGVALTLGEVNPMMPHLNPGGVYKGRLQKYSLQQEVKRYYRLDEPAEPVGIVHEGASIGTLRFETWRPHQCKEGLLVFVPIGEHRVYYQVIDGSTQEETFDRNRNGYQVVTAVQLGTLDTRKGFIKFPWLPEINVPVFLASDQPLPTIDSGEDDIVLGTIPGTSVPVKGKLEDLITHHTAVLGVTGTGKTEMALDIIRAAVRQKTKVLCVDLTGDYIQRLANLAPQELSLSENLADELGQKLFDVETGTYGAPTEKKVLQGFSERIRTEVKAKVQELMESPEHYLGIFSLPTISNTKATLYATEIYVSSIFHHAKNHREGPRTMVVLEEAHTVIPEASTMGVADNESRALVAKIAQIALQGRKYRVGLLVVAQRTATISKTVLTQCNTMISFAGFDQTGLDFLANVFGREHTGLIPNLRFLQALAFGKGISSERPVVLEVPFDATKSPKGVAVPAGDPEHPLAAVAAAAQQ